MGPLPLPGIFASPSVLTALIGLLTNVLRAVFQKSWQPVTLWSNPLVVPTRHIPLAVLSTNTTDDCCLVAMTPDNSALWRQNVRTPHN